MFFHVVIEGLSDFVYDIYNRFADGEALSKTILFHGY